MGKPLARQEIYALLVEASTCRDGVRIAEIQIKLCDAIDKFDGTPEVIEAISTMVNTMLIDLWRNAPHLLPTQAPFFYMICGSREWDSWIGCPVTMPTERQQTPAHERLRSAVGL